MPHPRSIPCPSCGKLYFSSSLPIHQKTCVDKQMRTCHECPFCRGFFPALEFSFHVQRCPSRPLRDNSSVPLPRIPHTSYSAPRIPRIQAPLPPEAVLSRRSCGVCGRQFALERLAVHENACRAVNRPRSVFDSRSKRSASCGLDVSGAWGGSPGDGTFGPPPPVVRSFSRGIRRNGTPSRLIKRPQHLAQEQQLPDLDASFRSVGAWSRSQSQSSVGSSVDKSEEFFLHNFPLTPRSRSSSTLLEAERQHTVSHDSNKAIPITKWRQQHAEFLALMARAKADSRMKSKKNRSLPQFEQHDNSPPGSVPLGAPSNASRRPSTSSAIARSGTAIERLGGKGIPQGLSQLGPSLTPGRYYRNDGNKSESLSDGATYSTAGKGFGDDLIMRALQTQQRPMAAFEKMGSPGSRPVTADSFSSSPRGRTLPGSFSALKEIMREQDALIKRLEARSNNSSSIQANHSASTVRRGIGGRAPPVAPSPTPMRSFPGRI